MDSLVNIWKKVLEIIKPEFAQMMVSYDTWIETIIPTDIDDNKITLSVPYEYNREIITSRYTALIKNALKFITGKDLDSDIIKAAIDDKIDWNDEKIRAAFLQYFVLAAKISDISIDHLLSM